MKRKLETDEVKHTLKGIERIENEIIELKESKKFNELTIAFQKAQDEYQDALRPYLRNKKKIENLKTMETLNQNLKSSESILNNLKDQIKNGVEIKGD